eukprot:Opistho-2@41987
MAPTARDAHSADSGVPALSLTSGLPLKHTTGLFMTRRVKRRKTIGKQTLISRIRAFFRPPWLTAPVILVCLVWIAFGIAGSLLLNQYMVRREDDTIVEGVRIACQSFRSDLLATVSHSRSLLDTVASAFVSGEPTMSALATATQVWTNGSFTSRARPVGVEWFMWLPRVNASDRLAWEATYNRTITQYDYTDGLQLVEAASRPEYFPTAFIGSVSASFSQYDPRMIGVDFGDSEAASIRAAAEKGIEGSSGPIFITPANALVSHANAQAAIYIPFYSGSRLPSTVDARRALFTGIGYVFINCSKALLAASHEGGGPGREHTAHSEEEEHAREGVYAFVADDTPGTAGKPDEFTIFGRPDSFIAPRPERDPSGHGPRADHHKNKTGNVGSSTLLQFRNITTMDDIRRIAPKGIILSVQMQSAMRTWSIICIPTDKYVEQNHNPVSKFVAAAVSVGSVMLCFVTLLIAKIMHVSCQRHEARKMAMDEAVRGRKLAQDMIGYVNHEIRNPLNGILGLMDLSTMSLKELYNLSDALTAAKGPVLHGGAQAIADSARSSIGVLTADIATARNCCQLISHIVNDVLDIRKIEEGRLVLSSSPLDVGKVVRDAVCIIRPKLEEKPQVSLVTECTEGLWVFADEFRVKQLLLNFLSNSVKFTDRGSISISAITDATSYGVRFSVKDTGHGIRSDQQQLIFKPYVQVRPTDGTRYTGTGLGLFLCQRLVELMDGIIGFESEYGIGSTFWFELPMSMNPATDHESLHESSTCLPQWTGEVKVSVAEEEKSSERRIAGAETHSSASHVENFSEMMLLGDAVLSVAEPSAPTIAVSHTDCPTLPTMVGGGAGGTAVSCAAGACPPVSEATNPPTPTKLPRFRLLVVDDVMVNRMVLRRQLEVLGHEVVMCEDGQKAVDVARKKQFDGIFMDVQMPVMNGLEATECIRRFARSSSAEAGVAGNASSADAVDVFPATDSHVPVFGVTADVTDQDVLTCESHGMDYVIGKPATQDSISLALSRFYDPLTKSLSRSHGRQAA